MYKNNKLYLHWAAFILYTAGGGGGEGGGAEDDVF